MNKRKYLWLISLCLYLPAAFLVAIMAFQKSERSNGDIIIRFDDYGVWCNQDWLEIEKDLIAVHERYGIKISFATIPESKYPLNYHPLSPKSYPKVVENRGFNPFPLEVGSERVGLLKESVKKGVSEVTLHGYFHPKGYSNVLNTEFYGVPYDMQFFKLSQGKHLLDSLFDTEVTTLVPPHNTYDYLTLDILEELGYNCISAKKPGKTAPTLSTGNIACLWHTHSDFHNLIDYFDKQEHYNNEPTPILMLHHTSFTSGGKYDPSLMNEYEKFLRILNEKNVTDYHFTDVYDDSSFLKRNDHLRKEVYKGLLNLGLPTKYATKILAMDSFMPLSGVLLLVVVSIFSLFCSLWLLFICLKDKFLHYKQLFISRAIIIGSLVVTVIYGIIIFSLFYKLDLLGWPVLLSYRMILLYLLLAFVLVEIVSNSTLSKND